MIDIGFVESPFFSLWEFLKEVENKAVLIRFFFVSKMVDWLELIFFLDSVLWTFLFDLIFHYYDLFSRHQFHDYHCYFYHHHYLLNQYHYLFYHHHYYFYHHLYYHYHSHHQTLDIHFQNLYLYYFDLQ